jgi:cobalt-zinc-cadmium efflux system membrane fusion protein
MSPSLPIRTRARTRLVLVLACLAGACERADPGAAPAHDHAHEEELEPVSQTVFGARLLLYLEHAPVVRGEPVRFLAHFSVLASGAPVRSGRVILEIGAERLVAEAPTRDGLFIPEASFPAAGSFPARIVLESEEVSETLPLAPVVVHASLHDAEHAAEGSAEPADAVPFLLEQQWKIGLLLAVAGPRPLSQRLVLPAQAVAPEGLSAVVSSPVGGRLVAPGSAALPRTGERVEAGRTLAFVEPPLGAPELAQLRALALELDLQALEVLRATGEAEARLRFAQRELERIGALRAEGLSTQSQLDAAEQGLALARTELEAAARTKASLERLQAEHGAQPTGTLRLRLDAPIAGVISEVSVVDGASVEAGAPAFRILDASRLWIEGRVSEFDLALLSGSTTAVARFAALPGRDVELAGLPWIGPEVEPQSRTLLVRYELDNPDGALRPGMLAELFVATGTLQAAVAVPAEALVLDQGLPTAYVMLEGELFQRRQLELGLRDGDWVEVLAGLAPGERVATRGAWLIQLAALPGAEFGHGHAH